jgi:biogenesis of lysosome-related organelles complex 1 subunit 2
MNIENQSAVNQPSSETSSLSSATNVTASISDNLASSKNSQILDELSRDMIQTAGDYIKTEIDICVSDYKVLERMNQMVTEKYKNLDKNSASITNEMKKLNEAYDNLLPLLSQIDDIENAITGLEQSANKLDVYSKRLESKYKQFAEKHLNK